MAIERTAEESQEPGERGGVVWLTGLSGAGKTTLANALLPLLRAAGKRVEILDGDTVRTHLSKGLGFSREDRDENVLRIAFVAHLLARNGVIVLVAAVSPYRDTRRVARDLIGGPSSFIEVHVAAPLEACAARDVKGLYKKAIAGEIPSFTGVSDPYEPPDATTDPENVVVIDTSTIDVDTAVQQLKRAVEARGWLSIDRKKRSNIHE